VGTGGLSGTWYDVTASRAVGTTYTNSRGYGILVSAYSNNTGVQVFLFYVNGVKVYDFVTSYDGGSPYGQGGGLMVVPAGATYSVDLGAYSSLQKWYEFY
jgi:hypothetical protein